MFNKHFNDFCLFCTGRKIKELYECEDTACPFYPFKYGDDFDEPSLSKGICKKLMKETGMVE